MAENDQIQEIEYKPNLAGKVARLVLPMLHTILPARMYSSAYDTLYNTYKHGVRYSYKVRSFLDFSADQKTQLKARLVSQMLPFTMGGIKALENAFEVIDRVEENSVSGAIVECGVAQGGTAAMMALASRELGIGKRPMWLFDSYEGLPEPTEEDYVNGVAGEFVRPLPKGACLGTVEQVSELFFDELRFERTQVQLVKGWFQDTVPGYGEKIGRIAVLRLDGDWYESTKIPLQEFYSLVHDKGIVIIDDYATCFGSRRATDEFREENNIVSPLIEDGRGGVWWEKTN